MCCWQQSELQPTEHVVPMMTGEALDNSDSSAARSPAYFPGSPGYFSESGLSAVQSIDEESDPAGSDSDSECRERVSTSPTAQIQSVNRPVNSGLGLIECLLDVADARRRRGSDDVP